MSCDYFVVGAVGFNSVDPTGTRPLQSASGFRDGLGLVPACPLASPWLPGGGGSFPNAPAQRYPHAEILLKK